MNTKALLHLLLLLCFTAAAQTTPITDINFEQQLVDLGIDTNGLNGNILDADAAAVTDLTITRNDISDFTGLEAFVNLTRLDLGRNNFLTAPMATLTLLEEFIFDDNNILDNLDLTQNVNLRILNIGTTGSSGNASTITTLDLSQNVNLESAYIYAFLNLADILLPQTAVLNTVQIIGTAEDIFDFTNHSGLEELLLNQNTSTTDITLPAVRTTLQRLDIRNQRVTSVDLTGFVALERVNLGGTEVETLLLPTSNALKRLTISRHRLPSVFSFASVPELEVLHVTSNLLTSTFDVDIRSNTLLTELDLSSNKMANLDMTQCTQLVDVDVRNNELITFDTSQNVLLEDLNASSNNITNLDLAQNIVLENLNLNTNELPTLNLATNVELRTLNLGTNQLPNLDITTNTKIRTLYIDNNLFTGTGLDLTQNVELSYLNAERNQIESLDITQNLDLSTIILNYNLFPGTAILDQFYSIRAGDNGISGGRLEVSHNLLTGRIQNFADLFNLGPADTDRWTRRFELTIDNNYFHFGDLEEDHLDFISYLNAPGAYNIPILSRYMYAPQAKVNAIENPTRNAGESITLTTTVRGEQNHYTWFKDGVEILGAPDAPEYTITDLTTCDAGVYHSEITSDLVPFENSDAPGTNGKNLLLVRNDITLTVNATKACVSLISPAPNDTNVPINTGVEWDENPGACGYKLTITNVDTGTPVQYGGSPITDLDVGDSTLFNFDTDLPSNTEISVQITPYFDDGDFGGCSPQSFTTNNTTIATECTALSGPENNDTDVATDISSISWNPANAADGYKLTITSTSGANDLPETNVGNTLSYALGNAFQPGDVVTVSVIPTNSLGDAVGCSSETFTIVSSGSTPPSCTSLVVPGPVDGATDVAVNLNEITWAAAANATQYRITIDGSSSSANDVTDLIVTGTSHPFVNNFNSGETITVTIVPLNGTVEPTTACTPESFTIVSAAVTDLYVDQSAPSGGDGTSWATAFQTIEEAVAVAAGNNTIFIAEGIYRPAATQTITVPLRFEGGYPAGGGIQEPLANITQVQADFNPISALPQIFDIEENTACRFIGLHFAVFSGGVTTRSNLMIDQCVFSNSTGNPLSAVGDFDFLTVESSTFDGASSNMISAGGNITDVTLRDVLFTNGSQAALYLTGSNTIQNIAIEDCAVSDFNASGNSIIDVRGTTATIENLLAENNMVTGGISLLIFGEVSGRTGSLQLNNSIFENNSGGGYVCMQARNTTFTMENTNFIGNSSTGGSSVAIMQLTDINLTAENCDFMDNTINDGPAAVAQGQGSTTDWSFNACEFSRNQAAGSVSSGLFQLSSDSRLQITNSIFDGNDGEAASAIRMFDFASLNLSNNIFRNHDGNGPIIQPFNGASASVVLENNSFDNNSVTELELDGLQSLSANANEYTGEVLVTIRDVTNAQFTNELFAGNGTSEEFIRIENTDTSLENCVLVSTKTNGNHSLIESGTNASLQITNSTFSASNIDDVHVTLDFHPATASQLRNSIIWSGNGNLMQSGLTGDFSNLTIANSLIKGEASTANGNLDGTNSNNIPEFVNPTGLDFQMLDCSSTVNAGQNGFPSLTTDYSGNNRIFETTVDLGAYELQVPFNTTCSAPTPPDCTSLSAPGPVDGATDVAVDLNEISWAAAANTTQYRITVSGTANNDVTDFLTTDTFYEFTGAFVSGETVTVTIVPLNGGVAPTTACGTESFRITSTPPMVPECTALSAPGPVNDDTDITIDVPQIIWNAVPDATGYLLEVSSTSGNNNLPQTDIGDVLSYPFPELFEADDMVTVAIIPYNAAGEATGPCSPETFSIVDEISSSSVPPCTELLATLNNVSGVPVETAIEWEPIDTANGYRIAVRTEDGEILLTDEDVGLLTSYNLSENLPYGTTILVSITPYNSQGDAVICEEQTFVTIAEPLIEDETKYGFSPNGDGINDFWQIENIQYHPENIVTIYNRWGDAVFRIEGYDNNANVFRGEANQMTKMGAGQLPSGTYFFDIQIEGEPILKKTKGFLVIKR